MSGMVVRVEAAMNSGQSLRRWDFRCCADRASPGARTGQRGAELAQLLLRTLHLTDSLVGLWFVYVVINIPLGVWLLRGFLDAIPTDQDEAVLVDGGRPLDVLRYIIVPLSRPGLMTIG